MTIEAWTGPLTQIDNTFGYNDMLLTPGTNPSLPIVPLDTFTASHLSSAANPSTNLTDEAAESILQPGDRLFRLPNGGIVWRRSIFADRCPSGFSPNSVIPMSDDMTRAVAYFSRTMVDTSWCRPHYAGVVQEGDIRDQATHWDLTVASNLQRLQNVLTNIRNIRANPSSTGDALARNLADAVSANELDSLSDSIRVLLGEDDALNRLLNAPWNEQILDVAPIAIGFALWTGVTHFGRYLLVGGQSPLKTFRVFGGLRNICQGIVDFFRRPPGGPGNAASGGGGTNPPPPSSNPPTNVARISVVSDTALGIAAFSGDATPVAFTGGAVAALPPVGLPGVRPGVGLAPAKVPSRLPALTSLGAPLRFGAVR